ncbi:MAG: hypothetical protein ABI650_03430, partial [Dokdonella sp.]
NLSLASKRRAVGLTARPRAALVEVSRAHARGDLRSAWVQWTRASLAAPGHAEVPRWGGHLASHDCFVGSCRHSGNRGGYAFRVK